jgi:iron-sulfur cluster repair protein YtfE (RIC family)
MSLRDSLTFKGTIATQLLRDQHILTVELSEGFLNNSIDAKKFLEHVDYAIDVHFPLEDNYLIPIFRPFLRKYLEFEEPIRVISGEHATIKRERQLIYRPNITESDEEVEISPDELFGKVGVIAKTLLQHVYKEENGLFGLVDSYLPENEKKELSIKLEDNLPILEKNFRK